MKIQYKSTILSIMLSVLTIGVSAQSKSENDSTLNRQILLERDFNPTLQDASKINTIPAIHEPSIKPASLQFETNHPTLSFSNFPIGNTGSGDIKTQLDYNKKRGYLTIGGGNYSNLGLTGGYRIVDSAEDALDFMARYNSSNGKIKYADTEYDLKDVKAKYNNILIGAKYQHTFSSAVWSLAGSYENTGFNYYGNPFGNPLDMNSKQLVDVINIETGLSSRSNDQVKYDASLKYDYFKTKYGPSVYDKGFSGNIIDANFGMGAYLDGNKLIGVRLGLLNQGFGDIKYAYTVDKKTDFHSLTKITATPHFDIDEGDYFLSLGLKTNYAMDLKNKFLIAPDVKFTWQFIEKASFYANITGNINENTYLQVLQENRYVDQTSKVNYSKTVFDGTIGFKSGVIEGFEFDIFGGYKQTNDDHLYTVNSTASWGNVARPEYYNVGTGHLGGLIKTNLIPYTDLSAKLVTYFYNVDGDDYDGGGRIFKPWNLPTFTTDLNADIKPIDNFIFSMNYKLATGRKGLLNNGVHKMKNINELNIGGEYQITDWISANIKLNNILNQKYESYSGYTHQGFNFMAGAAFKF